MVAWWHGSLVQRLTESPSSLFTYSILLNERSISVIVSGWVTPLMLELADACLMSFFWRRILPFCAADTMFLNAVLFNY